jgi:hypothetical protein
MCTNEKFTGKGSQVERPRNDEVHKEVEWIFSPGRLNAYLLVIAGYFVVFLLTSAVRRR